MSPALFMDWATTIALALLAAALIVSVIRIVLGPSLPDRVLALDLLTIVAMGFVGTIAVRTGLWLYLDIALALALLGFLATVALARYIMLRNDAATDGKRR
ncbi:monovalent cation/H+ antiporter complex subunit F [Devosia aurantiaca]|uniref:Cation:proton antiporter n=1 Tax=Devosia aurantiaca TaxID=2714858 RepID=A0A6M1SN63_9HYPH|nr:monovalent cation/H+ antiporter complex subunit F [Devosia aurantiaca]NGP18658.1 cation:proton antiporter [Devosia aurantiaca]